MHKGIMSLSVDLWRFVFFGEQVTWVGFTTAMFDVDFSMLLRFSNHIFMNVVVSETFHAARFGPVHSGLIIIVESCRRGLQAVQVFKNVMHGTDGSGAFISCFDFSFTGATTNLFLFVGLPH